MAKTLYATSGVFVYGATCPERWHAGWPSYHYVQNAFNINNINILNELPNLTLVRLMGNQVVETIVGRRNVFLSVKKYKGIIFQIYSHRKKLAQLCHPKR